MKRLLVLLIIISFSCLFAGCGSIEFNIEATIKPPVNEAVAVQGTWKIEKYISVLKEQKSSQKTDESNQKKYVGKEAIFDNDIGVIGKDVCINPIYKIIRTSADTFLQNKYQINQESLGLQKDKIDVVTISTENQLFYQLIVTDERTAYVYLENGFLVLRKTSDIVDEKLKDSSSGNVGLNINNGEFKEDPLLRSGVLIGVRAADNTYRTLWVYSKNREIKTISYRNQLILPRAKDFWEIGTIKNKSDNQSIFAEPFTNAASQKDQLISNKANSFTGGPDAKILFVGNDYIGIEHNLRFKVLPIDKLSEGKGIALSRIADKNSFNTFLQSSKAFVAALDSNKAKNIVREPNEENFTLNRRNGHWIMKSRLYYKEPVEQKSYEDFDLNLMVPTELIRYDEMNIPWNEIKSRLPWITDAYMSPNKDIAILVSSDSLNIYPVQNKSIVNKQLMKIPLAQEDSVIMTEWSIGKYADIWSSFVDKIFTNSQGGRVNY